MFDLKTYIARRKCLRDQFESGFIFFLGNDESPMNYLDNPYHFRHGSSFSLLLWSLLSRSCSSGGLRNEEDYLITETGYRLLGKPIPKTIEDVGTIRTKE